MKKIFSQLAEPKILITLLLGFSSGLPLLLSSGTLQAWYTVSEVSLREIGFIGLAGLPYIFKFVWAPLMDRWTLPLLGRRRGWILICQVGLGIAIASMAFFTPQSHPRILFLFACVVAFLSASQDIAFDAYRVDVLTAEERPLGAAMGVNGYRIAMIISGGAALIMADYWGWSVTYITMASLMGIGILATFLAPDPHLKVIPPASFQECTIQPFLNFFRRSHALWILLFIIFYKLGDAFAGALSQTFLIRKIQMTLTEIGFMVKALGFLGTVLGTTLGALLITQLGWFQSLLLFGVIQALSNLFYMVLLWTGPNYFIAGLAILVENLCGGMGTSAFIALLMGLCNPRFTAFQFALLSSLSAVGRVFVGPLAGIIAHDYGWTAYFITSLVLSVPGLILLVLLKGEIRNMVEQIEDERKMLELAAVPSY